MKIYSRPNYDPQELAARNNAALAREADRQREERLAAALRERIKELEALLTESYPFIGPEDLRNRIRIILKGAKK